MRWKWSCLQISSSWAHPKHVIIIIILKLLNRFQLHNKILSKPTPFNIHLDFHPSVLNPEDSTNRSPLIPIIRIQLRFCNDSENRINRIPRNSNHNPRIIIRKNSFRKRINLHKRSLIMNRINDCLWRFYK